MDADKCDNNCDDLAACACGLVYGDYKCACPKGYSGSGEVGQCTGKWKTLIGEWKGWWRRGEGGGGIGRNN